MFLRLDLHLEDAPGTGLRGGVTRALDAREPADNEENAVRLAEQLVREAFARHRAKLAEKPACSP